MLVSDYDYDLPEEAIAQEAIEPRDAARLLDTTSMRDLEFSDLPMLLEPGDVLVVNTTKVRAARLEGKRATGGKAEVLLTRRVDPERWQALVRPAKKLAAGATVVCGPITVIVSTDPVDGVATVKLETDGDIEAAIAAIGSIPLPPYFHGALETTERYQTMFADRLGSSAAPTAALHFTPRLVDELVNKGIEIVDVDLEVGLDTFRPMTDLRVDAHTIHTERIRVSRESADAINAARARDRRVVAVGTTVVRTLESAVVGNELEPYDGDTSLFITPGHRFRAVDAVITNFHAPRTTLLVLISALLGDQWHDVYEHAVGAGYRFLSFGDAMWIEVQR